MLLLVLILRLCFMLLVICRILYEINMSDVENILNDNGLFGNTVDTGKKVLSSIRKEIVSRVQ